MFYQQGAVYDFNTRNLIYSFIYSWIALFIFIVFDAFWRLCGVQRILNNNSTRDQRKWLW